MAITEDDRLALRTKLNETLGEREARVLMKALPPVDYDQLATKTDLETYRVAFDAEFKTARAEMRSGFAEVANEFASVRTDMAGIRTDMASQLRVLVMTHIASVVAVAIAVATLR
jgi:hypothetical protein